jgi:hypothetical protein
MILIFFIHTECVFAGCRRNNVSWFSSNSLLETSPQLVPCKDETKSFFLKRGRFQIEMRGICTGIEYVLKKNDRKG